MKKFINFALLCVIGASLVYCQTIKDVLDSSNCDTSVTAGLASQLVKKMNEIKPGLMKSLKGVSGISLGSSIADIPYAQTLTVNALRKAISQRFATLQINSALVTLPEKVLLYKWYLDGKCGVLVATKPGTSADESGYRIGISDYNDWRPYLESAGCTWQGPNDVVHFNYPYSPIGKTAVLAFQKLWNCNNPSDQLIEDGVYGPLTEAKMLGTPKDGFPLTC